MLYCFVFLVQVAGLPMTWTGNYVYLCWCFVFLILPFSDSVEIFQKALNMFIMKASRSDKLCRWIFSFFCVVFSIFNNITNPIFIVT